MVRRDVRPAPVHDALPAARRDAVADEVAEGGAKSRNVVIEFPSYEQAVACYHSPEYAKAIAARKGAAFVDLIIIEGYNGPQPQ